MNGLYEAAEPSNCPDAHVLGRTVRELFPYFTERSFNAGMAVTNAVTGEKRPMTTVKLNGRWWNVYAMDKQTQGEWDSFTPIPGRNSYWPTSAQQVVAPYAFRFNQSINMTNSLLAEDGQGYYDPNQMRHVQPEQSVTAKKLHRAITSPDNGVFWQRDTAFDDGQSQFCTYTSSTYTGAPRQGMHHMYGNFERTNCTFIFEPAAEPTAVEFDAQKNGFMKRVYAERRAYYMRHQNLGHYYIDPQDDPVAAQAKVMGEFKERIARDRIYQLKDPAQRRADGRIYSVTPSRIYQATRNMRNAASPEEIELHNSEAAHDAVVFRNPQAEEVENRANVRQIANIAAQYRAAQALRGSAPSRAAGESKGDDR